MIRHGRHFVSFLPAVSRDAIKTMSRQIRCWHLARRSGTSLGQLARMINSIVQGWMNYYGRFFTPRELEIIRMAANGLSNRRSRPISWRRYAVDDGLGQVYAKLGIGGRDELTRIFTVSGCIPAPLSSSPTSAAHVPSRIG